MNSRRLLAVSLGAFLLAAGSGTAQAMGVGVEVGGTVAHRDSGAPDQDSLALGLIIDNTFNVTLIDLTLWMDVQTLMKLPLNQPDSATSYIPVDLGLRVGLALPVEPYVGLLIGGLFHSGDSPSIAVPSAIFAVGGDLGADIVAGPVRLGLELRGESMTGTDVFQNTWAWQLLASARFSF